MYQVLFFKVKIDNYVEHKMGSFWKWSECLLYGTQIHESVLNFEAYVKLMKPKRRRKANESKREKVVKINLKNSKLFWGFFKKSRALDLKKILDRSVYYNVQNEFADLMASNVQQGLLKCTCKYKYYDLMFNKILKSSSDIRGSWFSVQILRIPDLFFGLLK